MIHRKKNDEKTCCGQDVDTVVTLGDITFFASRELKCEKCATWKPKMKTSKIVEGLLGCGFQEENPFDSYRVFSVPQFTKKFFVGKSGSLRFGKSIKESDVCTSDAQQLIDRFKRLHDKGKF